MCLKTNFKLTENKTIHKIKKWKIKTALNAVTGTIEFIWIENAKKFRHRNLKKIGICRFKEGELWR